MATATAQKTEPIRLDVDAYEGEDDEAIENYYEANADTPGPPGVEEDDWAE